MMYKHLMMAGLAATMVMGMTGVAHAEVLNEIDLGKPATVLTLPPGNQDWIRLNNTTSSEQIFRAPDLQVRKVVPANDFRTLIVNPDLVNRRLEYMIGDAAPAVQAQKVESHMEAMNAIDLEAIKNPNTSYTVVNDPEPNYNTHAASKRQMIRGYW